MEKVIEKLLETVAAAIVFCFVLNKFMDFLLEISCF